MTAHIVDPKATPPGEIAVSGVGAPLGETGFVQTLTAARKPALTGEPTLPEQRAGTEEAAALGGSPPTEEAAPLRPGRCAVVRPRRHIAERVLRPHTENPGGPESAPSKRGATAIGVTSPGEPLEPGQEALGGRRRSRLREHVLQPALGVGLGLALRTGGEMSENPLPRLMTELAVHQGGEPVSQMLLSRCRT